MNLKHLVFRSTLVAILLGCSRVSRMDYRTADPIADAKRAFSQDDYRVVGVKLGDTVLAPVDSSVGHVEVNVQLPNGPVRFLALDPQPANPDRPSEAQLSYLKRYNTEIWTRLRTLREMPVRSLPPNVRLKLSGAPK